MFSGFSGSHEYFKVVEMPCGFVQSACFLNSHFSFSHPNFHFSFRFTDNI